MEFVDGQWPGLLDFLVNVKDVSFWLVAGLILLKNLRSGRAECCVHGHLGVVLSPRPTVKPLLLFCAVAVLLLLLAFPLLTYPGFLSKAVLLIAGLAGLTYCWRIFQPLTEWGSEKSQCLAMILMVWIIGFGGIGLAGVWYH